MRSTQKKNNFPKQFILVFSAIIASMFIFTSVSAIGISPPLISINFEPGLKKVVNGYVRNTENVPMTFKPIVSGDLAEYVKTSVDTVELAPYEIKYFDIIIELPEEIEMPGLHETTLTFGEVSNGEKGTGVTVQTSVLMMIHVRVPYPGKYLTSRLAAENVALSEPVNFAVSLTSLGTENVTAYGTITVSDTDENVIKTLFTDAKVVEAGKKETLGAVLDTAGMPSGRYLAHSTVEYGGDKLSESSTEFKIGEIFIEIRNITYDEDIYPEDIVKFNLDLDSYWNLPIEDAFVTLNVYKDDVGVGSTRSETFDLGAWERKNVQIFWDTDGLDEGTYKARFTVNYGDKKTEKEIDVEISSENNYLLLILLVAIIIAAIAITYKFRKKRRE